MYVEDVEDIKTSHNRCILKYVKDVEDNNNNNNLFPSLIQENTTVLRYCLRYCLFEY